MKVAITVDWEDGTNTLEIQSKVPTDREAADLLRRVAQIVHAEYPQIELMPNTVRLTEHGAKTPRDQWGEPHT